MTQVVPIGSNTVGQTGLYGGVSPITSEERATANNGIGMRMTAVRRYRNWFTQPFTAADVESGFFNSGHLLLVSVSNLNLSGVSAVTHAKVAAGTYNAAIDAMWDRIAVLSFDSNVATITRTIGTTNTSVNITGTFTGADVGASITGTGIPASTTISSQTGTAAVISHAATATGSPTASIIQGLTWPYIEFIYEHEVDAKGVDGKPGNLYYSNGGTSGTKDTAADFIAAWKLIWNRWQLRAAAHGVPTSRVKFNLCFTAFGFSPDRVSQYYAGGQWVDVIGVDPYPPVSAAGWLTGSPQGGIGDARPWCIARGKPMSIPEWNFISTDDTARPAAMAAMASQMANDTQLVYDSACLFLYPDSTPGYAINKVAGDSAGGHAYPLTHAAFASMVTTLGGNPIRTGVVQADPTPPSITSVTSNTAGTQIVVVWGNPPGGDNDTGWNVGAAPGTVTSSIPKVNTAPLAAGTRTLTITALASGAALIPGGTYTVQVVALNAGQPTGQAASLQTVTMNQPGPNPNAPVISAQSAVNDPGNSAQIDFTVTATSPLSLPLTITHKVTGPAGFAETFTGASTNRTYTIAGPYKDNVTVADNATPNNVTPTILAFNVPVGASSTPNLGLYRPPTGVTVNHQGFGVGLRGNFDTLDTAVGALNIQALSAWNKFYNLAGSSFDPVLGTSLAGGAASFLCYNMVRLEATSFSGVVVLVSTPLTGGAGAGLGVGIHDSAGNLLVDAAGNTASYSGTAVNAWLNVAADAPAYLTFPTGPITKRTFGEFLYVSLYIPPAITPPSIYAAQPNGGAVSTLAPAPINRYGQKTAYSSGIPSVLPFATADTASISAAWFGLLP